MHQVEVKDWQIYISRPFTLLGASLWHQWYCSELCKKILGVNIQNGLLIENPKDVVRYYRKMDEQDKLFEGFNNLSLKIAEKKLESLLKEGLLLNKKAKLMLKNGTTYDLKSLVNFLVRLSLLSTVLPFRVGDNAFKNKNSKNILDLVKKLRIVSYYPKVVDELITPMVKKELERRGIFEKNSAHFITFNELIENKIVNIKERILQAEKGKTFIYENLNGIENVTWTDNPLPLIKEIEKTKNIDRSIIKGNIAFKGFAKGVVKLVITNKISGINFKKGYILVAISTSPELMPIIKKCGAIITDEGGVTCHAAIISRELKIPCIVGTKIATQILKDGDLVEVDANNGIVKIIK